MQTSVRLMTRLICTIHAITATGKLYAEAGYEYSSDRSSIRLKMYAPIKLSQNYQTICSPYSSVVCNLQISCKDVKLGFVVLIGT